MQRLHRLLDRSLWIETVNDQKVDVVDVKALERSVDRGENVLAVEALLAANETC